MLWFKKTPVLKITLFISIVLMACDMNPETNEGDPEGRYDIYIAGYTSSDSSPFARACYWKNGSKISLSSLSSSATSITVSGNDIFIAGREEDTTTFPRKDKACYWKNGTKIFLSSSESSCYAYSVALSGYDFYFVGDEKKDTGIYITNACYWKNGEKILLSPYYHANAITAYENDIFIAGGGGTPTSGKEPAWYWINGTAKELEETGSSSGANSIFVVEK